MEHSKTRYEEEVEINLYDLWIYFLRKLWLVLLALLVFAALLGGRKLWSNIRQEPAPVMSAEEIEDANATIEKNEKTVENAEELLENEEMHLAALTSYQERYEQILTQVQSIDLSGADELQAVQVWTLILDINEKIISIEDDIEDATKNIQEIQAQIISLEEDNADLAEQIDETAPVSKRAGVVRNAALGAVLGVCIALVCIVLRYCFDGRLRGEREMYVRFGVSVAGTLRLPLKDGKRHGRYRQWLDRLSGDAPEGTPEEQFRLAASKIQILCAECPLVTVTGTLPRETLEQFCDNVGAYLPEGFRLTPMANPQISSESVLRIKESPVLLLEKVHTSRVSDVRNLLHFLRLSETPCLGAMILREGAGGKAVD